MIISEAIKEAIDSGALFDRYLTDIAEGRLTPDQASAAYESAARVSGRLGEETIKQAST